MPVPLIFLASDKAVVGEGDLVDLAEGETDDEGDNNFDILILKLCFFDIGEVDEEDDVE